MNRKISLVNNICYLLMEFLLMTVLYLLPQALVYKNHSLNYSGLLLIGLLLISDYILKEHCKNFILYLLGHLLLVPFIFIAGFSIVEAITLGVFILYLFITSISFWQIEHVSSRQKLYPMPLAVIIVFIAIEIFSRIMELNQFITITFYMGIAFTILFMIRYYLGNMLDFLYGNEASKNTPFLKIFYMNSTCNAFLLLLSIMLIIIANFTQTSKILAYLWYGIKYLLAALIHIFPSSEPSKPIPEPPVTDPFEMPENPFPQEAPSEPNPIIEFIIFVIMIILFLSFIGLLLYAIYKSFKALMKRYTPKTEVIDFIETIQKEDKKDKLLKRRTLTSLLTGKTNNQKVRKIYYKRIKVFQNHLVDITTHDTPGEINHKVMAKSDDSISTLTHLYEKARYGKNELKKDDVVIAKKIK